MKSFLNRTVKYDLVCKLQIILCLIILLESASHFQNHIHCHIYSQNLKLLIIARNGISTVKEFFFQNRIIHVVRIRASGELEFKKKKKNQYQCRAHFPL